MSLSYERGLRTGVLPSTVHYACDGVYLAAPYTRTTVGVWNLREVANHKPLELEGHHSQITALRLGHSSSPKLLCSCCDDYVIVWDVKKAKQRRERDEVVRGIVIGASLGAIQYCAFSDDDERVVLCSECDVMILSSKKEKLIANLEGHTGKVTCAEFRPKSNTCVISAGEDRTFKIWDLSTGSITYQSGIISASPFICLKNNPFREQVAIGTADGQVRVYDLTAGKGFRCLHHLDIAKISNKLEEALEKKRNVEEEGPITISSRPKWQTAAQAAQAADEEDDEDENDTETACNILDMIYTTTMEEEEEDDQDGPAFLQRQNTVLKDLLKPSSKFLIGTTRGLLQLSVNTLEVCSYHSFQDPIPMMEDELEDQTKELSLAGNVKIAQVAWAEKAYAVIGLLFTNVLHLVQWDFTKQTEEEQTTIANILTFDRPETNDFAEKVVTESTAVVPLTGPVISVLSNIPLADDSPLRSELNPKPKSGKPGTAKPGTAKPGTCKPGTSSRSRGNLLPGKRPSTTMDKPVTFHKIKSSGYSSKSRTEFFKPNTSCGKAPKTASSLSSIEPRRTQTAAVKRTVLEQVYENAAAQPTVQKVTFNAAERMTPINHILFSGTGQHLAAALGNKLVMVFKMPWTAENPGTAYTGHNSGVNTVHWSQDNKMMLSTSDDKTASLWFRKEGDPILTLTHNNNNFNVGKENQKPDKDNPVFSKSIKFGRFYYMDKFVLLGVGNCVNMYKYYIDPTKDDLKRYLTKSRYKLVKAFPLSQAQNMTALSAINSFYSYLVLAAGSDKSLDVFDMNVGKCVRTMTECHTRPCHVIHHNLGSAGITNSSEAYDLFATAGVTDCIKLWDLRTNSCVRRYEGHVNRSYPCGLALSPCGRYIATGSEDKAAYIYDLRGESYLHKLTGHTEVVTDVVYHPLKTQLITASVDGKLRVYLPEKS